MDQMKLDYFVSRYADFDEDALAELQSRADTLAEEAAAALDIVLAKRGIDKALLVQRAMENEESPPPEPKRSKGLMAAQLFAVAVIIVFSKALAEILPHWVSLIVVLGFLGYWAFRWFRK